MSEKPKLSLHRINFSREGWSGKTACRLDGPGGPWVEMAESYAHAKEGDYILCRDGAPYEVYGQDDPNIQSYLHVSDLILRMFFENPAAYDTLGPRDLAQYAEELRAVVEWLSDEQQIVLADLSEALEDEVEEEPSAGAAVCVSPIDILSSVREANRADTFKRLRAKAADSYGKAEDLFLSDVPGVGLVRLADIESVTEVYAGAGRRLHVRCKGIEKVFDIAPPSPGFQYNQAIHKQLVWSPDQWWDAPFQFKFFVGVKPVRVTPAFYLAMEAGGALPLKEVKYVGDTALVYVEDGRIFQTSKEHTECWQKFHQSGFRWTEIREAPRYSDRPFHFADVIPNLMSPHYLSYIPKGLRRIKDVVHKGDAVFIQITDGGWLKTTKDRYHANSVAEYVHFDADYLEGWRFSSFG